MFNFRIHTLEEQLKDMEVKSDERVKDEQRKYQDMIVSLQPLLHRLAVFFCLKELCVISKTSNIQARVALFENIYMYRDRY